MGMIAVIIIFICLSTDNMVTANMSGMNMDPKTKSVFSIRASVFFAVFNALFFTVGYIASIVFFRQYFASAGHWVAFSFLVLLGIKYMLEAIEKSPSFKEKEVEDTGKLVRVSLLSAVPFFFVGYPLELVGKSWFPQIFFLIIISFIMTILGFHLGTKTSKSIVSKKIEFIAGLVLVIMSIRLIIL